MAQYAALYALRERRDGYLEEMRQVFAARRQVMVEGLCALPGIRCFVPRGAFYVFANVQGLLPRRAGERVLNTAADLADYLLETARVAVVPGEAFWAPGYLRLSYAVAEEVIRAGIERIGNAISELKE
ncbi:MAG: aminotransferase class I/II-fold pyridoxal phosphate-dependent enzyme [Armatimonadota bacterium]